MSGFGAERVSSLEMGSSSAKRSIRDVDKCTVTIVDDKLFVAVGKDVKENTSTVIWALQNSGGRKICILHVHTPSKIIPVLGGKFPVSQVGKQEVMAYHEKERKEMHKALDEYIQLCAKAGVSAEKLVSEADSIEDEIVELISQNRIGRLVMGAAADNKHKKNMIEVKSKKAMYVRLRAPMFCHIWFICKGYLIYKRAGVKPQYPSSDNGDSNSLRSRSVAPVSSKSVIEDQGNYKSRSVGAGGIIHNNAEWPTESRISYADHPSTSDELRGSPVIHPSNTHQRSKESSFRMSTRNEKYVGHFSPHLQEKSMNEDVYDQLDTLMKEVDNSREEAYLNSTRRRKAEMECLDVIRKAKAIEALYYDEQKLRKELEEKLAKETEELETIKSQHAKALEELQIVLYKNSSLEKEIKRLNIIEEELMKYKKNQDDLKIEHDTAFAEADQLRRQHSLLDPTSTHSSRFFVDFTLSEIAEATDNFNLSRKIGEGGFGYTYKGLLRHTEVAIKVLNPNSEQGPQEFQQEVNALSKLRHPHIVTLIGVCSEASAIVYEYLPNGSLEDRLSCKDSTPPLSWQTRIKIATELCSALIFLCSSQPESVVHSDLKPANVLLDSRFSCKLSDFGICRTVSNSQTLTTDTTRFYITDPKGTFAFMDPEFVTTGELTPKSDVYSFGIILLRLLTGLSPFKIAKEVQCALDKGKLGSVLDTSAGDWPVEQANQLAVLGLGCCEMQRKNRPDLVEDVWRVLERMMEFSG